MKLRKYSGVEYRSDVKGGEFVGPDPGSNIKNAPKSIDGHNYDPKQRIQYSDASYTIHSVRGENLTDNPIDPAITARHQESQADFPDLNLSGAEYVILFLRRHNIGIIFQLVVAVVLVAGIITFSALLPELTASMTPGGAAAIDNALIFTISAGLCALVVLGAYVTTWVYRRNVLFLTNESIIQERQYSLFSKYEQTISLGSIEDARYQQNGLLQMIFGYGTIQLTVEGHGTSYVFTYAPDPKTQTDIISNAIEAFKNGRPVRG